MVGTGTVLADDPTLTARLPDGSLAEKQPLRVVVGKREIPSEARVLNDDSRTMVIRTHDPAEVLQALADRTDVLLEGGPTLAGAFLRAGVINRILVYVAPILLGGPVTAVDDVGVPTIARALRWQFDGVDRIGPDLLLSLVPHSGWLAVRLALGQSDRLLLGDFRLVGVFFAAAQQQTQQRSHHTDDDGGREDVAVHSGECLAGTGCLGRRCVPAGWRPAGSGPTAPR